MTTTGNIRTISAAVINRGLAGCRCEKTHQADPADAGLGHGTLAHLGGLLSEEEVELVIVLLATVWDEVCVDECGICGGERGRWG